MKLLILLLILLLSPAVSQLVVEPTYARVPENSTVSIAILVENITGEHELVLEKSSPRFPYLSGSSDRIKVNSRRSFQYRVVPLAGNYLLSFILLREGQLVDKKTSEIVAFVPTNFSYLETAILEATRKLETLNSNDEAVKSRLTLANFSLQEAAVAFKRAEYGAAQNRLAEANRLMGEAEELGNKPFQLPPYSDRVVLIVALLLLVLFSAKFFLGS